MTLIASNSSLPSRTAGRPSVTSYDSGYEHSFDHYVDVKFLLEDAEREARDVSPIAAAS
ncbi:MAG: hypothetical protein ABSG02_00845 [Terriglobales bacterium]|jgi:hypothetical protein